MATAQNTKLLGLDRVQKINIKDFALEQLKRYILSGVTAPGERLPSERELAEQLGVGRNSVREALKILEAVGLVEAHIGEGTFITAQVGATFGRTVGYSLALWGGAIVEILDARQAIEIEAARLAAERSTGEDLLALQVEVERMAVANSFAAYLAADMNFHRLIGKGTHNEIVAHIVSNLIDLLEEVLREAHTEPLRMDAEGSGTHQAIYAAIMRRDAPAAAEMMRQHLHFTIELWQAVISVGANPPAAAGRV
ncbi:MAG TPA: FadR/GntR family transcriptional regulator [Caldilineaceae bacterium]|nr:FadR/GntR family transcriptional regulator [Caldilineaceae bacterium]